MPEEKTYIFDVYVHGENSPRRFTRVSVCEHLARRDLYQKVRRDLECGRVKKIFIEKILTHSAGGMIFHPPHTGSKRIKPKNWSDGFDTESP